MHRNKFLTTHDLCARHHCKRYLAIIRSRSSHILIIKNKYWFAKQILATTKWQKARNLTQGLFFFMCVQINYCCFKICEIKMSWDFVDRNCLCNQRTFFLRFHLYIHSCISHTCHPLIFPGSCSQWSCTFFLLDMEPRFAIPGTHWEDKKNFWWSSVLRQPRRR